MRLASQTNIDVGLVGGFVIEAHLQILAMLSLRRVGNVVGACNVRVRQRIQIDQHLADWVDVRSQVAVRSILSGIGETARDFHRRSSEIAATLSRRRHIGNARRSPKCLALDFKTDEEEKLLAILIEAAERAKYFLGQINRAADGSARIVKTSNGFLCSQRRRVLGLNVISKAVIGGQGFVAGVVIQRAMKFLTTGFGRTADLNTAVAVFGGKVAGLNRDFLNKVIVQADD